MCKNQDNKRKSRKQRCGDNTKYSNKKMFKVNRMKLNEYKMNNNLEEYSTQELRGYLKFDQVIHKMIKVFDLKDISKNHVCII